jgi:hypothetical protein
LDLGVKQQRIKAWRQRFLQTGSGNIAARGGERNSYRILYGLRLAHFFREPAMMRP